MKNALRIFCYLLVGYLLLSLESPLLTSFHIRMYAPDPVLAAVVFAAASLEFIPGIIMCAFAGLIKDGFSAGVPIGMYAEIYVLVFLVCYIVARRLDYRNVVLITVVVMCASLFSSTLFFILSAIFDRDFEQFDLVFRLAIPQALITAPMGPIVSGILARVDARLFLTEKEGIFR